MALSDAFYSVSLTACCTEDSIANAMIHRRNKRIRSWAAWVLPALLWRALIPIGFMPMVGSDHSVQLVVCDSYAPLPAAMLDMPMDGEMDMSHRDAGGDGAAPVHQDHGTCPYGSSPALGALPTLAITPVAADSPPALIFVSPDIRVFKTLSPAHAARAPPSV
jgi:hypothetical protein